MTAPGSGARNESLMRALASNTDECILWSHGLDNDGYSGVVQSHGTKRKAYLLVCEGTHGPKPDGTQAAHSCGVRSCVNPRHLRWLTPAENNREKARHGTVNCGERQGSHKLTEDDVRAIRSAVQAGEQKQDVAARFGVVPSNVTLIVQRRTWRHVA